MSDLKHFGTRKAAVIFIDYKMKLNPIRLRESTMHFYGKKGMSWHGNAVFSMMNKSRTTNLVFKETLRKKRDSGVKRKIKESTMHKNMV